jgi:hypothetical protein
MNLKHCVKFYIMNQLHTIQEVSDVLQVLEHLKKEQAEVNKEIDEMVKQFHTYHIFEEECEAIANKYSANYFEAVYNSIQQFFSENQ